MSKTLNYGGVDYTFEDGISDEEAIGRIKTYLAKQPASSETRSTAPKGTYQNPKYEGFLTEMGEGVASGVIGMFQGVGEFVGILSDLSGATKTLARDVEEGGIALRNKLGIDPAGMTGKITEGLVQFGVPGLGAAGLVAKGTLGITKNFRRAAKLAQKGGNISRARKTGIAIQQIGAAGLADAIVSTDNTETVSDFFEQGPFQTDKRLGLQGREDSYRRLMNKVHMGAEGAIATAVIPSAIKGFLKGTTALASANIPVGKGGTSVAEIVSYLPRKGIDAAGERLGGSIERFKLGESVSTLDAAVGKVASTLTYKGLLDPVTAKMRSTIAPAIEGDVKIAERKLRNIDDAISQELKREDIRGLSGNQKVRLMNSFMDVLEGTKFSEFNSSPDNPLSFALFKKFEEAKNVIDNLSKLMEKTGAFKALPEVAAKEGIMDQATFSQAIKDQISSGGYLQRKYQIFSNKNYKVTPAAKQAIRDQITGRFGQDGGSTVNIEHMQKILNSKPGLSDQIRLSADDVQSFKDGNYNITQRQADIYIDQVFKLAKDRAGFDKSPSSTRYIIDRLNPSLINKTKVDDKIIQQIYGQIKDPREAYISTVAELSGFLSTDAYYTTFKNMADKSILETAEKNVLIRQTNDEIRARNNQARQQGVSEERLEKEQDFVNDAFIDTNKFLENYAARRNLNIDELTDAQRFDAFEAMKRRTKDLHILGRTEGNNLNERNIMGTSPYGAMFGYAVPKALYKSLSTQVQSENSATEIIRAMYAPFLKMKGMSQYAKTILSPYTQVRNVTSAAMFALAQGNIGKGANVFESVDMVLRDIIDKGRSVKTLGFDFKQDEEALNFLAKLQKQGVVGSSANLREILDNIQKGLGYRKTATDIERAADIPEQGAKYIKKSKDIPYIGKFLQFSEDLYRGGDDIWKIYNYTFEKNKIRQAQRKIINSEVQKRINSFGRENFANLDIKRQGILINTARADANKRLIASMGGKIDGLDTNTKIANYMDEMVESTATDNVRNLVPNYDLTPEAIKGLRKLPLGNFISFPAEIMRTGFNTINVALKEMGSNEAAIREIGVRRMMGAMTAFGTVGTQLQNFGQYMTGTNEEEIKAAQRLSAPYQRNSQFIPVGRDKKGNLEFIDFSHTNPYDLLLRPIRAAITGIDTSGKLKEGVVDTVTRSMWESMTEFFNPFLDESMIFSAIADVMPIDAPLIGRNGETRSGAKIYNTEDSKLRQFEKSMIHVMNTFNPGILPVRVPIGAEVGLTGLYERGKITTPVKGIEFGRFARGIGFGEKKEPTTGRDYTPAGELFRAFTGIGTQTIDKERILGFKSQEFKENRSKAASIFNQVVRQEKPSSDQIIEAYKQADDARLTTFREMRLNIQDLKKLGASDRLLRKGLKDAALGVKERSALMRDKYIPFRPSKDKMSELRKKKVRVPTSALNRAYMLRNGLKLSAKRQPLDKEAPGMFKPINLDKVQRFNLMNEGEQVRGPLSPLAAPLLATRPQASENKINTPLSSIFGSTTPVSPSILGDNPEDVLKNMQIARNR